MKIREVKSHVLRHALPEAEVFGSSKGWPVAAISAIDIALWDLTGKALRQPVCQLLGGAFRREVRAYATGLYRHRVADNTKALAEEAEGYAAEGFRAMKMKVGCESRLRRRPGDPLRPEGGGRGPRVVRGAGRARGPDGYCQVKAALGIPVSGGETEYTRWGFRELCARRAVDIVQPDICGCGASRRRGGSPRSRRPRPSPSTRTSGAPRSGSSRASS